MSKRRRKQTFVACGALLALLLGVVTATSLRWIGRTFPGFLLMANRVVPSIALPSWADGRASELFQHQVLEVDGTAVSSAAEVYRAAEVAGVDRPLTYALRAPSGEVARRTVPTRRFGASDYAFLFGAYLLNGLLFCAIGLMVLWLEPHAAATRGLAAATLATGTFVITAADLYGPHWFFRLHVAAETAMIAGFVHLALVFPTDRLRRHRTSFLALLYAATAALALLYEASLWNPTAYTRVHLAVLAGQVLGCAAMIVAIVHDFVRSRSPLVRRRIGVVALGVGGGMLLPVGFWASSAVLGGTVSMNWAALTAFCFPLSVAYAVLQEDLFEIDVVVRRAATYVAVVAVTIAAYVVLLALVGSFSSAGLARQPTLLIAANVVLLLLLGSVRTRIQRFVDGVFFRLSYDAQATVTRLGQALESALHVHEVVHETRRVLAETFFPRSSLLAALHEGRLCALPGEPAHSVVTLPPELGRRLAHGGVLARYAWDDGSGRPVPELFAELDAELLVPVRRGDALECVIALGGKESGRAYNVHDAVVLQTIAGQVSLALATARAFEDLAALNASLERQVAERTAELASTNRELSSSLHELNDAYRRLEQNQKSLLQADRLATLGKLAAGIAHEISTPLAAVMNSLRILSGLGHEYAESIADASVTVEDHREIARDIQRTVESAETWAARAATYVGRIRSHGHEPSGHDLRRMTVGDALTEVAALLDHRLRASGCRIAWDPATAATALLGDVAQLVHLLLNVVDNAIGAYEELDRSGGVIEVRARECPGGIELTVRDHATGVAPEIAARIFDELFTTKERGKGTGLGLWIARNIAERSFAGSLDLVATDGPGACFRARLESRAAAPADDAAGAQAQRTPAGL